MILEEFNEKKHDLNKIAEMIFLVDEETFLKVFKDKDKAILAIKEKIIIENKVINQHSQSNTIRYILLDGNNDKNKDTKINKDNDKNALGMILVCVGKKESLLSSIIFLLKNLSLKNAIKFIYIDLMDYMVLSNWNKEDTYLAELAVNKNYQGKGYGQLLLNKTLEIAKNNNSPRLVLDVDIKKERPKKIYEIFGFKVFNKKIDNIFAKNRGMYNMEYIIN
ncbi:MAG: GNAT family N-acetyltransferase [Methanobrevibacter sp.]|jgi:ribosomal protein S18 acetylase RimI-like enzyme|nr:GNAT family N-acetyltransferase [Candidatus Methanoflexus mossambicus]